VELLHLRAQPFEGVLQLVAFDRRRAQPNRDSSPAKNLFPRRGELRCRP
jgi:hypothetical protein